jgi:DNA-binding MarR family transcriptional regulator
MLSSASLSEPAGTGILPGTHSDILTALEELGRAHREAAGKLAHRLGWPRAGIGVIRLLALCGPVQITDVAAKLRVDVSVASRQVSQLVDAGYVQRTVDEGDRRVRLLELTGAGRTLVDQVKDEFSEVFAKVFVDWSAQDVAEAAFHIRRVAAAITNYENGKEESTNV